MVHHQAWLIILSRWPAKSEPVTLTSVLSARMMRFSRARTLLAFRSKWKRGHVNTTYCKWPRQCVQQQSLAASALVIWSNLPLPRVDRLANRNIWQCSHPSKLGKGNGKPGLQTGFIGMHVSIQDASLDKQQLQAGHGLDIQFRCPRHCPTLHQARPEPRTQTSQLHISEGHQFLRNLCRIDCPPGTCTQCNPGHTASPTSLTYAIGVNVIKSCPSPLAWCTIPVTKCR